MRRGFDGSIVAAVVLAMLVAGCGGGGSSPRGNATPLPTPLPTATPTANPAGSTAFAVTSVPVALAISYSDGITTLPGKTPITLSPDASNVAFAITFVPTNGNALYTFIGAQRNDGTRTVLYNQNADTAGSIAAIGASAIARGRASDATTRTAAALAASGEPRVTSFGSAGRPHESATRVVVRYRVAALENGTVLAHGRAIGAPSGGFATYAFDVPAGTTAAAYAQRLRTGPGVESAAPDMLYYKQSTTPVSPNDTHFDDYQQWSLFAIRAPNAWGYTEGSPAVQIAIVDTGADFHQPDLAGAKIVYAESDVNGVTTVGAAAAQDTDGHGTNVAGVASADTNNGLGFAGTGFNVGLQIYKVFPDDSATNNFAASANASDVTLAIDNAVAHGARVINLSIGGCAAHGPDPAQQAAIDFALAHQVVVVAAAGNERSNASTDPVCQGVSSSLDFPAAYAGVISVGASKLDDSATPGVFATAKEAVASYSNAGPDLSLVAPGGDPPPAEVNGSIPPDLLHWIDGLYTTTPGNPNAHCKNPADCRALFSGTSQATPHVSGTAALLLSINPNLSAAQVRTLILANADDIGDPLQGDGRLNAYRALAALTGDPVPPALPTAHNFVAFAYAPSGTATPKILDVTYPGGVPVASDGTFRIADIPANAPSYKIGVWYDANGNGIVDAGDYFAASGSCSANARCASASGLRPERVSAGFVP